MVKYEELYLDKEKLRFKKELIFFFFYKPLL